MITGHKFGTFGGVFTPCTLTILGVIMFLRFGQVVGEAGLINALIILAMAKFITTLTSLSLSAIATNTRVEGGGAYFLICRSLGVEFGGAIGVVFFLAQAISIAMYVIGFSEAFVVTFPEAGLSLVETASIVNFLIFLCVWIGAAWAMKVQYAILAILVMALGSFFFGAASLASTENFSSNLVPHYKEGSGFFVMFALFFPAVTGIMSGANMSGDLKDPARSIPGGTLAAVAVTAMIYAAMAVMLAFSSTPEQLLTNNLIVKELSFIPWMITAGIFAATLSSALAGMMGAPRIFQAVARDEIFPGLIRFARGHGENSEPRAATLVTFIISQLALVFFDLNAIAPIISMSFMITYGTLNLATFYESITKNPSYRPRFRFSHWSTALLGAVGCIVVMFLIDPIWALVAILAMMLLHSYISRKEIESRWGDVHSGVAFERARKNLLKLEEELDHPKNWRPVVLALSGGAWSRLHLARFAHWFTAGHGILSIAQIIVGDDMQTRSRQVNQRNILKRFIDESGLQAFPAVVTARTLEEGIQSLVQCHGIGSLCPNTVLLGWPGSSEKFSSFSHTLRIIKDQERSIVVHAGGFSQEDHAELPGTIDVWWRGAGNGALMLLLAHLLVQNPEWRHREIRLIRTVSNEAGIEEVSSHLNALITDARIVATAVVIISNDFKEALTENSKDTALTFLGFEVPAEWDSRFFEYYTALVEGVGSVFLVKSAGGMQLVT